MGYIKITGYQAFLQKYTCTCKKRVSSKQYDIKLIIVPGANSVDT